MTKQEKTCARCEGTGSIEPAWPVGPGGGRIEPYKCAACGGTGKLPISRPVMNPPVDEAEAGNRANTAPRQADPDAPCRGETGVSSGSEARPVTATELLTSNRKSPLVDTLRQLHEIGGRDIFKMAADEIERLTRELEIQKKVVELAYIPHRSLSDSRQRADRENERLRAVLHQIAAAGDPWSSNKAHAVLSGDSSAPETKTPPAIVGWAVGDLLGAPAMYNKHEYERALDAARRWDKPITALIQAPGTPSFAQETGKDECQHDLLKPDTTIEVIDQWKAKCKVCITFFDIPGRPAPKAPTDDVCRECGVELVADTCDKCGAENGKGDGR